MVRVGRLLKVFGLTAGQERLSDDDDAALTMHGSNPGHRAPVASHAYRGPGW